MQLGCERFGSAVEEIDFVRSELREHRFVASHDPKVDAAKARRAAPVCIVGDHFDARAAIVGDDAEGSGSDRQSVVREVIEVGKPREQVFGQDHVGVIRWSEERVDERCERSLEVHDDGLRIDPIDAGDDVVPDAADDRVARIEHLLPGVDYVVGAKGRAVLPPDVAAQMVGDPQPVCG